MCKLHRKSVDWNRVGMSYSCYRLGFSVFYFGLKYFHFLQFHTCILYCMQQLLYCWLLNITGCFCFLYQMLVVVTRLFVFIVIITFLCNIVAKILTDCGTSAMLAISRVAFATKKQITNWRCAAAVTSQGESLQCESDRDWSESGVTLWIQMSLLFFLSFLGMRWEFRLWRKSLVNNCFSKGTLLTTTEERVNQDRQKKLLNVFTIVNFPNNECTAGSTNTSGDIRCHMENVGGSSQWKNQPWRNENYSLRNFFLFLPKSVSDVINWLSTVL